MNSTIVELLNRSLRRNANRFVRTQNAYLDEDYLLRRLLTAGRPFTLATARCIREIVLK